MVLGNKQTSKTEKYSAPLKMAPTGYAKQECNKPSDWSLATFINGPAPPGVSDSVYLNEIM